MLNKGAGTLPLSLLPLPPSALPLKVFLPANRTSVVINYRLGIEGYLSTFFDRLDKFMTSVKGLSGNKCYKSGEFGRMA